MMISFALSGTFGQNTKGAEWPVKLQKGYKVFDKIYGDHNNEGYKDPLLYCYLRPYIEKVRL